MFVCAGGSLAEMRSEAAACAQASKCLLHKKGIKGEKISNERYFVLAWSFICVGFFSLPIII